MQLAYARYASFIAHLLYGYIWPFFVIPVYLNYFATILLSYLYRVYLNLVARILERTPIFTPEIAIRIARNHINGGEKKIQDNPSAKLPANHLQNHLHAVQWAQQYGLSSWNKSSHART